jgi:hypothetical protein
MSTFGGGDDHSSKEEKEQRTVRDVELRFVSSARSQIFTCTPNEQETLRRRSDYFKGLLENATIEIPEENAVDAISFLAELIRDTSPTSITLGLVHSWVMFSAKW